jgi:hypothetical protein
MNALLDALGFVGDAFDRPGAAVRGLLAGRPDQLGYLVPGAETMGLVEPSRRVSGADLLRQAGLVNGDDDSWGSTLGGMAVDVATNPLTYLPLLGGAAASRFSPLKAARSNLAVASEVDPATGVAARVVGGSPQSREYAQAAGRLLAEDAATGAQGLHFPAERAAATLQGTGPQAARHEIVHSLVDQVSQGGPTEGMPWPVRMAGWLGKGGGNSGPRAGLAHMANEGAAQALENRGLMSQLGGAGRFLFDNVSEWGRQARPVYSRQIAARSPLVGKMYDALPYAPAVGAGVGGGFLMDALYR